MMMTYGIVVWDKQTRPTEPSKSRTTLPPFGTPTLTSSPSSVYTIPTTPIPTCELIKLKLPGIAF